MRNTETAIQRAIEEWATVAGGPHADREKDKRVTLAHYIAASLPKGHVLMDGQLWRVVECGTVNDAGDAFCNDIEDWWPAGRFDSVRLYRLEAAS